MCFCDRHLSRRELMKGAMTAGGIAVAGGLEFALPESAMAAVAEPRIYSCSEWGARAASVTFLSKKPTYIVIHHTATSNSTATTQASAFSLARSIQNYHMNSNGWADTGQQFTVSRGGYAMEGRHQSLTGLRNKTGFPQGAHVGAGTVNSNSIGIENEGLYTSVSPPAALYTKLVDLCAYICQQFGLNPTNAIKGHRDFMATACPGNVLYSKLPQLRSDVQAKLNAGAGTGYTSTIDNSHSTRFTASGNWGTSSWSSQKNGANYRYANPTPASDAAWYKFDIPATGSYLVDAWWPADAGYNNLTPFVVVTSSGNQSIVRSQRTNGGKWNNLGTFTLAAGDYNAVGISRWTSGTGYVIADAIRVRKA